MNRFKKLSILVWKNFKSHKWLSVKIIVALACLCFLVCLFSTFSLSLYMTQSDMKLRSISANYIISNEEIKSDLPDGAQKQFIKQYDFSALTQEVLGESLDYMPFSIIQIQYDEKNYWSTDDESSFDVYFGSGQFTDNDFIESEKRFNIKSLIIGDYPYSENEVLISEYFLNGFGFSADDVLGKKISISFRKNSRKIVDSMIVSGIIRKEYYELSGHEDQFNNQYVPSLIVTENNELFKDSGNVKLKYLYSFSEWLENNEVSRLCEKYDCVYAGNNILSNISLISKMQILSENLFVIVGVAIGVGLLLTVYLLMEKYIKFFSRNGGILQTCGLCNRELYQLLYCQLLFLCLFSALIAVVVSLIGYCVINSIIFSLYYITIINISFYYVLSVFAISILMIFLVASVLYLYAFIKTRKKGIKEMLETKID